MASFLADNAKIQYDQFMTKEVGINQENFLKLNFKTNRLDSLLYELVAIDADYSHLKCDGVNFRSYSWAELY